MTTVTLRFSNATATREETVEARLTPKKIDAYGRWFSRETGLPTNRSRSGATFVRVIAIDGTPIPGLTGMEV